MSKTFTSFLNKSLRKKIVELITKANEGHIPSNFSVIDILEFIYSNVLRFDPLNPNFPFRDYFILSKGHASVALYVVLNKHKILSNDVLNSYGKLNSILGGHPDSTKIPGVEFSTGSLGHGFPMAAGVALGSKIQHKNNRVFVLIGDGECNEGTIWETALVAAKQNLNNLIGIVDLNGSAAQILPVDPLEKNGKVLAGEVFVTDGHDPTQIKMTFDSVLVSKSLKPKIIIANTIKGKGCSLVEGHGKWHHRIPNSEEFKIIMKALT